MANVSKTADDVAREQGLLLERLDEPITKAAAIRVARHCDPWDSIGRAILQSFQDVKDIEERYQDNQQRREKILERAHDKGVTVREFVNALLEKKKIIAAGEVCKEIKEIPRIKTDAGEQENDGPRRRREPQNQNPERRTSELKSPGKRTQPPFRMIAVVILVGFSIIFGSVWYFYGTKAETLPQHNHIKSQDHSHRAAPQPNSQYEDQHRNDGGSAPDDLTDICKGQSEMERRDASELSKIIGTYGDWREWCMHLGVDEGSCNSIEHSGSHVTVQSLEVAQAYLKQLNTCWKKVVLVLCTKFIKPNCKAARDIANKHGIDYTTICHTCT